MSSIQEDWVLKSGLLRNSLNNLTGFWVAFCSLHLLLCFTVFDVKPLVRVSPSPTAICYFFFLWPICHVQTLLYLCCFNQIWSRPNVGDLSYDRTSNFVPSSWEMFLVIYLWFGGSSFNPFLNWRDMYCPTLKIYSHYLKFGWYFYFLNHMSQKASVHKFLAL